MCTGLTFRLTPRCSVRLRRHPNGKAEHGSSEKIQDAEAVALAHEWTSVAGRPVFENIVLGVGGAEYYQKAVVDLDMPGALEYGSTALTGVESVGELRQFISTNAPGRDWNGATSVVINGRAGIQIMGELG